MQTYQNLIDALKILRNTHNQLAALAGGTSPAYRTLYHAAAYLDAQATATYAELRGEEAF